jgi:crotonobetainyl-CoA:carnitine CoA-transferase CaiB-like acyl-CoA transferase
VTIVEFGYFYAMPYAVAMLAALGARVIKIEDLKGDPHRTAFGPEVASSKTTAGKESVSVDLSRPEGREAARRIVAQADVFVTGFRTGIPEKFGLGYDNLRKVNPRLLYVHAAGYGRDGPYAHRALYAQAAQAVGGSFGRQVGYWSDQERIAGWNLMELQALVFPRLRHVIDGDSNPSLAVAAAIALGIYEQRRSGEGQRLDTSMIAGNAWAYADDFCRYAGKPPAKLCDESYFGLSATVRLYEAAESSWVCIEARGDKAFAALARSVGLGDAASDPRFSTSKAREVNDETLVALLAEAFRGRTALEWEQLLSAARVGAAAVSLQGHPTFTAFDPGLRSAGLTVSYEHPLFGEMVRGAPPVRFSDTPSRVAPPCLRGQHNRSVLSEVGYSAAELDRLEASGVLRGPSSV